MTTYRAEINGETVWSAETAEYEGIKTFPPEVLARPAETPEGEPNPTPVYLYVDDVLVGIQRSHFDEAEQCEIAAAWLYAASIEAGNPEAEAHADAAREMKVAAADAIHNAHRTLLEG